MKNSKTKFLLVGFILTLSSLTSYSQSDKLINLIDSLVANDLNYVLDTSLTKIEKPDPLILVDGHQLTKEKFIENFEFEDIESYSTISDSLTFQMFDQKTWGGIIIIETNLTERKLKKKL